MSDNRNKTITLVNAGFNCFRFRKTDEEQSFERDEEANEMGLTRLFQEKDEYELDDELGLKRQR